MSLAETASTLYRKLKVPALGLLTTLHREPSQCNTIVFTLEPPLLSKDPTAQTLCFEMATAPLRRFWVNPGLGLLTMLHCEPFQCSIRVLEQLSDRHWPSPTAHTSSCEMATMPLRVFCGKLPLGLLTILHSSFKEVAEAICAVMSAKASSSASKNVNLLKRKRFIHSSRHSCTSIRLIRMRYRSFYPSS